MLPGRQQTPGTVLALLIRRRWLILLPCACGLALTPSLARLAPTQYRSETVIQVIPQRVPDNYVRSNVTSTVEDRLPAITDVILSRSWLERVITDFGLYADLRAKGLMDDAIARMRDNDVSVRPEGKESFRVSYLNRDPQMAQKVTARLASLYISENVSDRESIADGTNAFLSRSSRTRRRLLSNTRNSSRNTVVNMPASFPNSFRTINRRFRMRRCSSSPSAIR